MSKMKEIDDIAQGVADVTEELMRDSIDWQIADQEVTGDAYRELHAYVMSKAIEYLYRDSFGKLLTARTTIDNIIE